jgi:hypothetical protein
VRQSFPSGIGFRASDFKLVAELKHAVKQRPQSSYIRLPEELLKALKYRAIEEKKSVNQIIREAIEMSLAATPQPEEREMDPFEDMIGIARSGIKDASSKHDRYLYGAKR